jgi:hypothetical protein
MQHLRFSRLLFSCLICCLLAGCNRRPSGPVWNVDAFVGQNIDVLAKQLGPAQKQSTIDEKRAQRIWHKDDHTLQVTYKTLSKRVTDFTLISREATDAVQEGNKAALLEPGQLKEGDPRYTLEYIEAPERALFYTGVKVLPVPRNHTVTLRVTGSDAMLEVRYVAPGTSGAGDELLTLPPWEKTVSVPDDGQVFLSSRIYKNLGGAFHMKTEILADDKVLAQAASTGQPIQCQWEF